MPVTNFCYIFGRRNGGRLIHGMAHTRVYMVVYCNVKVETVLVVWSDVKCYVVYCNVKLYLCRCQHKTRNIY